MAKKSGEQPPSKKSTVRDKEPVKVPKNKKGGKTSKKEKRYRIDSCKGVGVEALKNYYPTLKQLAARSNSKKRASILNELPNTGINVLCECIFNALYSKHVDHVSRSRLRKLPSHYKEIARELALFCLLYTSPSPRDS